MEFIEWAIHWLSAQLRVLRAVKSARQALRAQAYGVRQVHSPGVGYLQPKVVEFSQCLPSKFERIYSPI